MHPIIISTSPENGSKSVAVDSTIVVTFAEAVLTSSITTDAFLLENLNNQTDIPCNIALNNTVGENDGTIVTITPDDDQGWNGAGLNGLTDYRLTISDVSSADGDIMRGSYTMDFTTVEDGHDETPEPADDAYVDESYELYGRNNPDSYEEPRKTWAELIVSNKKYLDYLLDENSLTAIDWNDPEYEATQYVEAKTRYDQTYHKYRTLLQSAQSKKLSDLSISYRSNLDELEQLVNRLEKEYKQWENELLGDLGLTVPQIFIKGSNVDAVYDFHDRSIKNRDGESV